MHGQGGGVIVSLREYEHAIGLTLYGIHVHRDGAEWKRIRSAAAKQVIPRRVGNFVSPLNEIADDFLQYVAGIRNKEGYVEDIKIVMDKFAFQGEFAYSNMQDSLGSSLYFISQAPLPAQKGF